MAVSRLSEEPDKPDPDWQLVQLARHLGYQWQLPDLTSCQSLYSTAEGSLA